ncbi:iron-dependent peroxidase [Paenibacillus alba]|uniref:Iron-dependent peroxidase n=1 Tax=Paenibacillus alba TaxID=1197127 RepID=A0ABU6FWK8_9BACL|nr:iron-dependent peroxidase [Paenibacillus alba]MEC0226295.1 iron-dependent peroxidase [Paenibacillus alba]NQX66875.1 iron-dependent peroxidase [Paenibacillus alba]
MGVNYIWDLVIKARKNNLAKSDLYFSPAQVYSPYMELSHETLNATTVEAEVEVNPYYRFYDIFRDLFDINNKEETELRHTLFDIFIHFLTDMDLQMGMNKREFYIKFVLRDLESGIFGSSVWEKMKLLSQEEQEVVAGNILSLYETGEAVYLLKDTMRKLFKHSTIYANCEERDELLFYVGQEKTATSLAKLELIKTIFLPVRFHTLTYWEHHFGIIDVEETMRVDRIAIH